MDETTHAFSPKVLDRAFSIEFDEPDLAAFPIPDASAVARSQFVHIAARLVDSNNPASVLEAYPTRKEMFDTIGGLLEEVRTILKPAGISFGYRPRDHTCLYMWHWQNEGLESVLPYNAALDLCVLQKVLPKLSGSGAALKRSLENLLSWLRGEETELTEADPKRQFLRSAEKVERMLKKLGTEDATTFWGT
jgi:5-methylcytosine-specific restriction endonuclease McrBC GTP-binding regulatory subunit McrB